MMLVVFVTLVSAACVGWGVQRVLSRRRVHAETMRMRARIREADLRMLAALERSHVNPRSKKLVREALRVKMAVEDRAC